jgi:hypothetical protein
MWVDHEHMVFFDSNDKKNYSFGKVYSHILFHFSLELAHATFHIMILETEKQATQLAALCSVQLKALSYCNRKRIITRILYIRSLSLEIEGKWEVGKNLGRR